MRPMFIRSRCDGVTLIELIVFLVIVGIALSATIAVFSRTVVGANDPLIQARALELAQAQLDSILSRRFDENTPVGGVPACDALGGIACAGISSDADFDDVGDFNGFVDTSHAGYTISVGVNDAGAELGLSDDAARRITVSVATPATNRASSGSTITLSAYKVNY